MVESGVLTWRSFGHKYRLYRFGAITVLPFSFGRGGVELAAAARRFCLEEEEQEEEDDEEEKEERANFAVIPPDSFPFGFAPPQDNTTPTTPPRTILTYLVTTHLLHHQSSSFSSLDGSLTWSLLVLLFPFILLLRMHLLGFEPMIRHPLRF
ncbi:hypothetical protein RIF29_08076 [Crotalaria pallida]|uniref:Uncharacterized protein n=1 Tax=Crotalaria pallida TaxID=3830 RepID=A0AAN9J532_CROPI